MSQRINANPALLDDVARRVEQIADEIRQSNNQLNNARNDTISAWNSRHRSQFIESADRTRNRVGGCEDLAREIARQLRNTAREVRRIEAEIARLKRQTT